MIIELRKPAETINQVKGININSVDKLESWMSGYNIPGAFAAGDVEEIRITFWDFPFVAWMQIYRKGSEIVIVLIVNDYPIGTVSNVDCIISFVRAFIGDKYNACSID